MAFLCAAFAVIAVTSALTALSAGDRHALARTLRDAKPHDGVAAAHTMPIQGIDVSYWQGDIDWDAVRDAGVRFAFIKATEGGDHLDPKFLENWYAAKRAGIARGAYHFIYWCRPANEQALWFMLNVPPDSDALPPVLDLEWNSASKTCPGKVDPGARAQEDQDHARRDAGAYGKTADHLYRSRSSIARCSRASSPAIISGCARSPPSPTKSIASGVGRSGSSPPRAGAGREGRGRPQQLQRHAQATGTAC